MLQHATAGSFLGISGVVWFWILTLVGVGAVVLSLGRRFQLLTAGRSENRFDRLGERFKHTQAVGKLKAEHDLPPSDPAREETQIARLTDLANRADLDPEFAKKFLNFVIQEVIQHHEQHQT